MLPGYINNLCTPDIIPVGILTNGPNSIPPETIVIILVFNIEPL